MRHGDKINNLGRKAAHRRALLSNLACQLFEHKHIITTLAKARALRIYAEPLVTRCKVDSTHNRRMVFSYLQDKVAVTELFTNISEKVGDRPGGYTRIIKMPKRVGDAADMAYIELVDYNETYTKDDSESATKKTRRSRRGGGSTQATGNAAGATAAAVATTTVDDTNDTAAAAETAEQDIAADAAEVTPEMTPAAMDESPIAEDATPAEEQEKSANGEGAGA